MLKHFTSLNQEKPIEQYFSLGFKLTVFSAITWVCCQCWKRRLLKNPWVLPTRRLAYNAFGNVNRLHSTPILKLRFQIKYPNVSSPIQPEIDFSFSFRSISKRWLYIWSSIPALYWLYPPLKEIYADHDTSNCASPQNVYIRSVLNYKLMNES